MVRYMHICMNIVIVQKNVVVASLSYTDSVTQCQCRRLSITENDFPLGKMSAETVEMSLGERKRATVSR